MADIRHGQGSRPRLDKFARFDIAGQDHAIQRRIHRQLGELSIDQIHVGLSLLNATLCLSVGGFGLIERGLGIDDRRRIAASLDVGHIIQSRVVTFLLQSDIGARFQDICSASRSQCIVVGVLRIPQIRLGLIEQLLCIILDIIINVVSIDQKIPRVLFGSRLAELLG